MPQLTWWTCLIATSGGSSAAVYYAPEDFRIPLGIGAGATSVVLSVAVSAAVYFRRAAIDARGEGEQTRVAAQEYVESATAELRGQLAAAQSAAAEFRADASGSESRRVAAMAAFAGAAGRMQAMTTSMLAELREMENRHSDADVLADLLQLDHRTAQAGRLADSIAVLSGARSGRRWAKPIAMQSILRGAMGRVAGYQRVRLRAVANIAIAGHAAEAVMHALAELIDNACNFSPPTTEVHLYAAEVPAGVVITIEDSGLVMSESALRRAEAAVSTDRSGERVAVAPDLSTLSGTRLGLSVVGYLARKHGLTVSYRPSAIGGTAVVVVVPRDLTTRVDTSVVEPPIAPPASKAVAAARPAPVTVASVASGSTGTELPKRRRGSTFAAVHPEGLVGRAAAVASPAPSEPASLGAFQRAITGREPIVPAPSAALETDR
ncbi:sensor histidine kinase [Nocardia arizonensis]|uniref:sensor histidine kinase n=1 Tax=Nocardia arizonensis TaxID=1141647 RepID=UPI0006D0E02C|nr:ATP-binding protein [Nocardia arizonensis]